MTIKVIRRPKPENTYINRFQNETNTYLWKDSDGSWFFEGDAEWGPPIMAVIFKEQVANIFALEDFYDGYRASMSRFLEELQKEVVDINIYVGYSIPTPVKRNKLQEFLHQIYIKKFKREEK